EKIDRRQKRRDAKRVRPERFEVDRDVEVLQREVGEVCEAKQSSCPVVSTMPAGDVEHRPRAESKDDRLSQFECEMRRKEIMHRDKQDVDDLQVFTEEESLIEIAAETFAV